MKTKIALLSLGLVSLGFSLDEYMPMAPGKTEIDVGVSPIMGLGSWGGTDGTTKTDATGSPMTTYIPLQVKYGIIPNLDIELAWTFGIANDDVVAGGASGFAQPDVAVKYAMPDMGLGAFVDVVIPFATGDYSTDPSSVALGIVPGVIYGKNYGKIQAVALASYAINMEAENKKKAGNLLTVFLKPGYMVNDALAGYLGLKYNMAGESETGGTANKDDGYLVTVMPGVTFTQSGMLAYELNVPYTVAGKNQSASWGVWASVYVTLGK